MKKSIVLWMLILVLLLVSGCVREKDIPMETTTTPNAESAVTKEVPENIGETVSVTEMESIPHIDETEETSAVTEPTIVHKPAQTQQTTEEFMPTETAPLSTQETVIAPDTPADGLGWG